MHKISKPKLQEGLFKFVSNENQQFGKQETM